MDDLWREAPILHKFIRKSVFKGLPGEIGTWVKKRSDSSNTIAGLLKKSRALTSLFLAQLPTLCYNI